jgi:isoprenylcysteine carboxyl methyltransferase (ICMT) family protein YpbQ
VSGYKVLTVLRVLTVLKVRVLIVLKVLMVPDANGARTSPHRWRQHPEPC